MKRVLPLLIWCGIIIPGLAQQTYSNLTFEPARPKPGEKIVVTYDPAGTPLAGAKDVQGWVTVVKSAGPPANLPLKREGNVWKGELSTSDSTSLALFTFREGDTPDNNNGKGYALYTYTPQGKPSPTARGWLGFYYGMARTEALKRDPEKALALFEEEFKAYPAGKDVLLPYYLHVLKTARPDDYPARASAELAAMAASGNLTVKQLEMLISGYEDLKQTEKADKYKAMLRKNDPKGDFVQTEGFKQVYDEQDLEKKVALFKQFKKDFPANRRINFLHLHVAQAYREHGKFADLKKFIRDNDKYLDADAYNGLAWAMFEANQEPELAETLAATAVSKARQERTSAPADPKAIQRAARLLGRILDTYGAILDKRGQPEKAYATLKESVELLNGDNAETNERYVSVLVKTNRHREAMAAGDRFIPDGKGTHKMKEDLRQAYIAVNGNEKGFDRYLASLEAPAREKMRKQLARKIISEPAPAFSLQDLKGNTVSLADLKGKTLVVDFWATWCGPCIASMPAMQQAVNKYKDNPDVKFLFINAWQNEPDKQQVVGGFLEKKKYDFTVPLDVDNKVISAYKVEGIPTKFVIDPQGNIRFKSVGFGGGPDAMVEELGMMIDMAAGKL